MKKAIAFILATVFIFLCLTASADKLTVKSTPPSDILYSDFSLYLKALNTADLMLIKINEQYETEDDFKVYSVVPEEASSTKMKIYTIDNHITHIIINITTAPSSTMLSSNEITAESNRAGYFLSYVMITLMMIEGKDYQTYQEAVLNDMQNLLAILATSTPEQEKNGVAATSSVVGYPAGVELKSYYENGLYHYSFNMIITGKDGVLTVEP